MRKLKDFIRAFNKDYPNGSITVTRIMREEPSYLEVFKAVIYPNVDNEKLFFSAYGEAKTITTAQAIAIKQALSLFIND